VEDEDQEKDQEKEQEIVRLLKRTLILLLLFLFLPFLLFIFLLILLCRAETMPPATRGQIEETTAVQLRIPLTTFPSTSVSR
jgi:hypothetical protein